MNAIQVDIHRKTTIVPGHRQDSFGFSVFAGKVGDSDGNSRQFPTEIFFVCLAINVRDGSSERFAIVSIRGSAKDYGETQRSNDAVLHSYIFEGWIEGGNGTKVYSVVKYAIPRYAPGARNDTL